MTLRAQPCVFRRTVIVGKSEKWAVCHSPSNVDQFKPWADIFKSTCLSYVGWAEKAISSSAEGALTCREICDWIANNVPGLKLYDNVPNGTGWRKCIKDAIICSSSASRKKAKRFYKLQSSKPPYQWAIYPKGHNNAGILIGAPADSKVSVSQSINGQKVITKGSTTYKALVRLAVCSSPTKEMTKSDIIDWMIKHVLHCRKQQHSPDNKGWKMQVANALTKHFKKNSESVRPSLWGLKDNTAVENSSTIASLPITTEETDEDVRCIGYKSCSNSFNAETMLSKAMESSLHQTVSEQPPDLRGVLNASTESRKSSHFVPLYDSSYQNPIKLKNSEDNVKILPVLQAQELSFLCSDGAIKRMLLPLPLPLADATLNSLLHQAIEISDAEFKINAGKLSYVTTVAGVAKNV